MEWFKVFMDIFERNVAEKNSSSLTELLKDSRKYFQNITRNDSELMLSILFAENRGLLHFLNTELAKFKSEKPFDAAIKEAFHLLEFIIEQFSDIFEPYIIETKDTCQRALLTKCSILIQNAACSAFNKLIEIFKESELQLGETAETFVNKFHLVSNRERCALFSVLGTIAKHNSEILDTHKYSRIFKHLRNDFKMQHTAQTESRSSDNICKIYLDVVSDILIELPVNMKEHYRPELYEWMKDLSCPNTNSSKKVSLKSAINLFSRHIYYFREFVYRDYKFWYKQLRDLSKDTNVQCKQCGQRALKRFFHLIGSTLKQKTSENDEIIFLGLKKLFEEQLKNKDQTNLDMLHYIVYGFSQMAAPCKRYLTNDDVKDMFSLTAHYALLLCSRENLNRTQLETISDYQEALSEIILHILDLSINEINVILKLSVLLVKRFPDIPINAQGSAISSLISTIINVGIINKDLLEEFLYHLFYDGITWSCSHTLFVDAELQRGLNDLEELPTCYKNYLPLWLELLKESRYKEHRQIIQEIVDSMMEVCIVLIGKLNLNTKNIEDSVFSDAAFSQIAENGADFRIFINIVDLYVDIIGELESILLINNVHKFLLKIISMSYKHPLISGFYKLVRATFKHIRSFSKDEIKAETLELLYKYVMNLLNLIPSFSNELLITCLYLILNMPEMYLESLLNSTIPAFKIAFTVGLSEFEVACTALNALEKWTNYLDNRHTDKFLRETVTFLEPYLHSGESSVEILQDIVKAERKVIKRIILRDDENTLERFQTRVLLFIASLDADIIMDFQYKRSMDTGATWDKKDLLKYSLIFSDAETDIYFDKILPRVILLAQNSGDRRTKIAACEVLHSIVAFILGKTSEYLARNPDRFVPVYMMLCPALLNLGCDFDKTARDLFQPLMLQLTHWLSSRFMLMSPVIVYFIDSFFNGLSSDSNSSLREFSGMCLAEFTKWSLRQSANERKTRLNIDEVVCKMIQFALHPSVSKRVAAATAFNYLYAILREDEEIVSEYWLKILHCFVKSLDGCNNAAIITALDHVERVLIAKKDVLNVENENRQKQCEFTTLTDAVYWLLSQCGCLDECCRTKCMELVIKFSEHITNYVSVEAVIKNYINTRGIENFNLIILKDLKSKVEDHSCNSILPLLRTFDCCIWLIRNNLLSVQYLFTNLNLETDVIFNCASNFVHLVNKIKFEVKEDDLTILTKELEDLQTLQCKVIIAMFDFLQILLNFEENFIPDYFFNQDFIELISKCIMCPQVVGFDMKNLVLAEALPLVMRDLLQSAMRINHNSLLNSIIGELSVSVEKRKNNFIDLKRILPGTASCSELKHYVWGLIFLEQNDILSQLNYAPQLREQWEDNVTSIFKVLAKEEIGELVCVNIKPSVKEYLGIVMDLLLMHYEPSMTRTLVELIGTDTKLGSASKRIEHGLYFLNVFKSEIFRYMLKDTEKTMDIFDEQLQSNPSLLLAITEQLFLFVRRHKKELHICAQILVDAVVKRFTRFEGAVNNLDDRKEKFISIYGIAVHLKEKPTELLLLSEDFYTWILNQLSEKSDIEYKIRILQNFLVCVTDMTSNTKTELLVILRSLRNDRLSVSTNEFSRRNVEVLKVINCFQTLLTVLPVTKSIIVLETIILFAAGVAEHLCDEKVNENLKKYFDSITPDYALESIEKVHKLFMNLNTPTDERFDILYKFLLPAFKLCKSTEIRKFVTRNIKEIYDIIRLSLVGDSSDMRQLITSKICCYELIAVIFTKIDIQEKDINSVIARNAIDSVRTKEEFLKNLYSSALNVRMLKTPEPEQKEIMRLLHCSAYNCSLSIVCLKKEECHYMSMFAENRKEEKLIWQNIVDCQKKYNFCLTLKEYPKLCKKQINIRKSKNQKQTSGGYSYIYSYDLSTCTLQEDINAYDFNDAVVRNKPNNNYEEESMSLTFESDELNNHECMASICGALNHIISTNISVPPTGNNIVMPKWLTQFCYTIRSTKYDNVRLFMLKIISNMQTVFKPYAKLILQNIMWATYSYLESNQLNYIIADVIEMLIDWQIVPDQSNGKNIAQMLWEVIIGKALVTKTNEIPRAVYKYNRNIVRAILETWQSCLKLPEILTDKMKSAPGAAVYLILICFVNGMKNDIIQRNDILEFLEKSLEKWRDDEETVLQSCECFGFILTFFGSHDEHANRKSDILYKIRSMLRQMQTKFENRQMKCIGALCKSYPNAAVTYFEFVSANMFRVDVQGKSNCLEIFLTCIPDLRVDRILKELDCMQFHDLLKNKILLCETIALKIINTLVPVLPPLNLVSLAKLVPIYAKHESVEYREIAYSIFTNIYKKYAADTSADENIRELMQSSREMLLNAVLDPAEQLQEKILNFWSQDAQLSCTLKERLLETLHTYTPSVGNNFLPFWILIILDLTKKSKKYTQKIFEPLHNCSYADYKISLPWRINYLRSKAPLFVPSMASEINQSFSQTSTTLRNTSSDFTYARPSTSSNAELVLQATQDPQFLPTNMDIDPLLTSNDKEYDHHFEVPKVPQPAYNKKSIRILSSSTEVAAAIRQKEIKRNIQRANMIQEEVARQRSSVKLYRKYRIGDFPDIAISHAEFIEPLEQLAKKDQLICKDLTVSIICSLLKDCKDDGFLEKVANNLKHIVENQQGTNSSISAILEVLLTTRVLKCSPEVITKVSTLNNLNFLGSLVLEENIIYDINYSEPPRKKARTVGVSDSSDKWLQLTNLYKSMNDIDVVLSIFRNHIRDEDMREAAFSQAANDWVSAKAAYEKAYETESEAVKEHCLQGSFECLSNLCKWNEIDKWTQIRLYGNLDNIWNDSWKDWMFPWLMEGHVRKLIDDDTSNDNLADNITIMESWLSDDAKTKHMKRFFGTELSPYLFDKLEVAREFLLNTLDEIREQWIALHPLSTQLKAHKLQKLRIINDVNHFIRILKTAKAPCDLQEILKFWNKSVPSAQDSILPWDTLTSYRINFISHLLNHKVIQCNENETQDESEIHFTHKLHSVIFQMRLKMIEAALDQKNRYIARKYLLQLEKDISKYSPDMVDQFLLMAAKKAILKGEINMNMNKKWSNYASAWEHCHNLLKKNDLDPKTNVAVRQQVSKLASKIVDLSEKDETFSEYLTINAKILRGVNPANGDLDTIRDSLEAYSLNSLKTCCDPPTTNSRECYFTLARYCYDRLSRNSSDVQLRREFVNSTLKAMSYGSLEAAHYFPCLLKPEYFEDEETKYIFLRECDGVQTWLFLPWQAQLFSHLETLIAPLIIPILKRIVETYPDAVLYTSRLTAETNRALLDDTRTYEIRKILDSRPEVDKFLLAMQYVVQPELYLQYYLSDCIKNLRRGTLTAIHILLNKVYRSTRGDKHDPKPGSVFNKIKAYESRIENLRGKSPEEIKQRLIKMIDSIKESLCKRMDSSKLKDYSPWLHEFRERNIEIPGQYTGNRKPMPQYHAKIIKFESSVKVMQSLRKPIRITMVGNDAKEYHFLVKFGEDLRQDQRLQQLFTIMNKTLHTDTACRQRQLSVDTYQVIPLSRTVGFIQWIDNTRSLQELIHYTLSEQETGRYDSIPREYEEWICRAVTSRRQYERYKEATVKCSASKVIAKMNEFINKTEWDSLRRTFMILCPSVESFVTMRRNFITAYATMCIAHWILGIGDRHLGNILIAIGSGRCLGIDFGLAFGAGIDQKIPELMPFRLTPQILGLLKPFTENDLLGTIMIHVLRALRNEQGPILSCMDVFVHEPLNWTEHVNKAERESEEDITDIKWVPKKKIEAVAEKLNGIKPSLITLEQLKEQHNDKYFDRYYAIITGTDDIKRTRTRIEEKYLTPEKQVECLLDQATDLNILGRSFVGWKPWL